MLRVATAREGSGVALVHENSVDPENAISLRRMDMRLMVRRVSGGDGEQLS